MRNRFNSESGMTLIELMFAAGIMAVALSLLFGSLIGLVGVGGMAEDRTTAATHLGTVMEELAAVGGEGLLSYQPPLFQSLGRLETVTVVCYALNGTTPICQLPLAQGATAPTLPNPVRVQCTIQWTDQKNRQMSVQASKLFCS